MVSVLVVEDSPAARELLVHLLSGPDMKVVGTAADGVQAVEMVSRLRPDVVTMDIVMPRMDGLEATRRIMSTNPLPIVIVSGTIDSRELNTSFRALEAGALAAVGRPAGPGHPEYEKLAADLRRTVRLMAGVKVVRRWDRAPAHEVAPPRLPCPPMCSISIVAMGASTGGPPALQKVFGGLPQEFPVPIVVVQHLAPGFLPGMLEWLGQNCRLPLSVACAGERLVPGRVYFAPDDVHMEVTSGFLVNLTKAAPEHGARPSVSRLFRSVASSFGEKAAAVLLSGMGVDGADEMVLLRRQGAVTVAQDKSSCVVYGMPAAATSRGGALHELAPEEISPFLARLVGISTIERIGG